MISTIPVNQQRVIDLFLELATQDTPSRHELAAAEIVRKRLEALGFECEFDDAGDKVGGNCGNLIAYKQGSIKNAPVILYSSHFDTVEPTEGLSPIIEGDIIRSDGKTVLGADDKSGLASIVEALEILSEQKIPHGDIQLILTICEEIGLLGSGVMDPSRIRARYGYVIDTGPPVGAFTVKAPSHDTFEVTIHGRAAHAGTEPEEGVSAIIIAAKAIEAMKLGRIDHETTANVGVIRGGSATNIIPETVYLKCEARSHDSSKLREQRNSMIEAFQSAAKELGGSCEIKLEHNYSAYALDDSSPALALAKRGAELAELEYITRPGGGGSDANNFNRYGIMSTVIGCGMQNAHQHSEFIHISDIVKTARLLVGIAIAASETTREN
jgi:tripeptide aminopeptidase